jgi:hypothetical protein
LKPYAIVDSDYATSRGRAATSVREATGGKTKGMKVGNIFGTAFELNREKSNGKGLRSNTVPVDTPYSLVETTKVAVLPVKAHERRTRVGNRSLGRSLFEKRFRESPFTIAVMTSCPFQSLTISCSRIF